MKIWFSTIVYKLLVSQELINHILNTKNSYTYRVTKTLLNGFVTDIYFAMKEDRVCTPSPFEHLELESRFMSFSIRINVHRWIASGTSENMN